MDELMVVVGGIGVLGSTVVQLYVYIYACNEWTDVTPLMTCKLSMITCTDVRSQSDDSMSMSMSVRNLYSAESS